MKKSIIMVVKLTCLVLVDYERDARATHKSWAVSGCTWKNQLWGREGQIIGLVHNYNAIMPCVMCVV